MYLLKDPRIMAEFEELRFKEVYWSQLEQATSRRQSRRKAVGV
jgi:hypothetical protein